MLFSAIKSKLKNNTAIALLPQIVICDIKLVMLNVICKKAKLYRVFLVRVNLTYQNAVNIGTF